MAAINIDETYLTGQFQEFYREVIHQKRAILAKTDKLLSSEKEENADAGKQTVKTIHSRLLGILEAQALDAGKRGGEYGVRFYQEAQYVMAALADEIFLHIEWDGRELWKTNLLEFTIFGTYVAGEVLFQRLEKLLKERDAAFTGMAAVYHLALSLGFRGKFRDKDDKGKLDFYRRQLFAFIFNRNPDLDSETRRLFPEAYAYTVQQAQSRPFPYIGRWIALIAAVMLFFLAASHGLWLHLTRDMVHLVENFIK